MQLLAPRYYYVIWRRRCRLCSEEVIAVALRMMREIIIVVLCVVGYIGDFQ